MPDRTNTTLPTPPVPSTAVYNAVGDEDPQSPTVMLQSYLRSKGLQPTAANVSAALSANAANPGVISGLVNQAPPSADPNVGGSGNVAGKVETAPGRTTLPVPPIPPTQGGTNNTSAPPTTNTAGSGTGDDRYGLGSLGALILGGAGGGGLSALARRGAGPATVDTNPAATPAGNVDMPFSGRTIDVPPTAITGDRYAMTPDTGGGILGGPPGTATPTPNTTAAPTSMESAMLRAIQPPAGVTATPGATGAIAPTGNTGNLTGDINPIDMQNIIRSATNLPPGVTPTDATVRAVPNLTTQPAQSRVGTAQMPPTSVARDPVTGNVRGTAIPDAAVGRLIAPSGARVQIPYVPRLQLR